MPLPTDVVFGGSIFLAPIRLAPNGVPRKVPKKVHLCRKSCRRRGLKHFFGLFIGTQVGAGTFRSALLGTHPGRGCRTSLDGRQACKPRRQKHLFESTTPRTAPFSNGVGAISIRGACGRWACVISSGHKRIPQSIQENEQIGQELGNFSSRKKRVWWRRFAQEILQQGQVG